MGIIETVAAELDKLSDRPGGVCAANLVHCPTTTALLAHGDFEQAFEALSGIRRRNTSRDVDAAFARLGGFGYVGNTEERLNAFAAAVHESTPAGKDQVSSRTVRRWSESGQRILVDTIVRASGIEPPALHLDVFSLHGSALLVLPTVYHMIGYLMNDPLLIVVGAEVETVMAFPVDEMEEKTKNMYQPKDVVEIDVGIPAHIQLVWQGEVQPTLITRTTGFDSSLIQMSMMTNGAVGLALYLEDQEDYIDTLAETAAELGRLHAEVAIDLE